MSPERDARHLVRPHLLAMPGYEPVEPIDVLAQRLGIPEERIVKLDGNENPYGPSPKVSAALAGFHYYHLYPDPNQTHVRAAVARYIGADPAQVMLGNGSDELLTIVCTMFISPGDAIVNAPPTFGMYDFLGRSAQARIIEVARREDFSLDVPTIEDALSQGAKLLFLASPNNPTGNSLPRDQLQRLLRHRAIIVLDEAYAEFSGESAVDLVHSHDNLIVVRTFSKWAGLAGLRAGYAIFPPALVNVAWKVKVPYSLNAAAERAVLASLEDCDRLKRHVSLIVAERERLCQLLATIPWLRPYPSEANFVLCEVRGASARDVRDLLRQRGVLVRFFDVPALRNCLRISVGRPEHTDRLIEALEEIGVAVGK